MDEPPSEAEMGKQQPADRGQGPAAIDPLLLQAYFDDELESDEADRVAALIAETPQDQARLDALEEMRELVRFDLEQHIEDVDLACVWERLEPALKRTPAAAPVRAAEPGWLALAWRAVHEFFGAHSTVLVPTAVAAVVVSLVLTPILMNQRPTERVVEKERTIVIVEPLRFEGGSTGAVSYTPQSNTPVIWYLGGATPEPGAALPAAVDREQLPGSVKKILERLERLERLGWPSEPPGSKTSPHTPPASNAGGPI